MANLLSEGSPLARMIRSAAGRGAVPHAVIFSGGGDTIAAARFAAAALVCRSEQDRPCLQCTACRKVMQDIHPDVRLVQDSEHKELPVETVRELRQDVYIRPNDGERKVYIFTDCAQLSERGQNVLLKIVEEGPSYAAFFFCTENAAGLLPTVRSRCVEWKLRGQQLQVGDTESAQTFCRVLAGKDPLSLSEFLVGLENRHIKREQLQSMLQAAWQIAVEALKLQYGLPAQDETAQIAGLLSRSLTRPQLQKLIDLLHRYCQECEYNVGGAHVLGAIAADWSAICSAKA